MIQAGRIRFQLQSKVGKGIARIKAIFDVTANGHCIFACGNYGNSTTDLSWGLKSGWQGGKYAPLKVEFGRWYAVRIEARGSQFKCYVDDELLITASKAEFTHGKVGFATWSSESHFKDIEVRSPDGVLLWRGLPRLPSSTSQSTSPASIDHAPIQRSDNIRIDDNELVFKGDGRQFVLFGDPQWTDIEYRYKVCRKEGNPVMGCYFKDDAVGNRRIFAMGCENDNASGIHIRTHKAGRSLGGWNIHGHKIVPDHWYDVRIVCNGIEFSAYVDGIQVRKNTVPNIAKRGAVGLYAKGKGTIAFEDVRVIAPDGNILWEGFPDLRLPAQMDSPRTPDESDEEEAGSIENIVSDSAEENSNIASNDGFVPIFDGRDLNGWHETVSSGVWSMNNGVLVGKGQPSYLHGSRRLPKRSHSCQGSNQSRRKQWNLRPRYRNGCGTRI